jgi:large subunit ribosomal protein L7A
MQELKTSNKRVVGLKQTVKAVKNGTALRVYLAKDADDFIKKSALDACIDKDIQIIYANSMKELGEACGIDVGTSAAAVLKD